MMFIFNFHNIRLNRRECEEFIELFIIFFNTYTINIQQDERIRRTRKKKRCYMFSGSVHLGPHNNSIKIINRKFMSLIFIWKCIIRSRRIRTKACMVNICTRVFIFSFLVLLEGK